jgi:hypothetical protein
LFPFRTNFNKLRRYGRTDFVDFHHSKPSLFDQPYRTVRAIQLKLCQRSIGYHGPNMRGRMIV